MIDQALVELSAWLVPLTSAEQFQQALKQLKAEYEPSESCLAFRISKKIQNLSEEEGKGLRVEYFDGREVKVSSVWSWDENTIYLNEGFASICSTNISYDSIRRFWLEI